RRLLREAEAAGPGRETQIDAARRCWREGFIAEAVADFAARPAMDTSGERHAGVLTGDDLARYEATYEEPVRHDWNGWTVCKAGPWSQGPALHTV
ncbi:gamma-glutamyltransferase, partial [Streptomyces daliensis]|nr:gamma-glutamyltransferase [Streptomyces daliensis]